MFSNATSGRNLIAAAPLAYACAKLAMRNSVSYRLMQLVAKVAPKLTLAHAANSLWAALNLDITERVIVEPLFKTVTIHVWQTVHWKDTCFHGKWTLTPVFTGRQVYCNGHGPLRHL